MRMALALLLCFFSVLMSLRTGVPVWIAFLPLPLLLPMPGERRTAGVVLGLLVDAASGHPPGTLTVSIMLIIEAIEPFRPHFADTMLVRGTIAIAGSAATLILLGLFRLLAVAPVTIGGVVGIVMVPLLNTMTAVAVITAFAGGALLRPRKRGDMLRI